MIRKARRIEAEQLDSAAPGAARANLADLVRINRWFGGHRIARELIARLGPPPDFSLLDVGAASGDIARAVQAAYPQALVVCMDLRPRHLERAPAPKLAADAFRLPFAPRSFDYVFCSLFLHHFSDGEAVRLLGGFARLARKAVIAVDLERSPLAEWFLTATRPLLRWHNVTLHDGPVSVRAAFREHDLDRIARQAGLGAPRIRRHRPWFRLSLVAEALS
jgi:2-polyprenyl-3-methyl-5-hydroxy-6-metoxy-1,4-benzoquinol methylase